jgi:exodeoxyribonuclease V alpha subunit
MGLCVAENAAEVAIEGEVERITFESADSGFRVIKIAVDGRDDLLAVVGTFPRVPVGARVRVRGSIVRDAKWGEQLRAQSVTELAPNTLVGIERYLGSGMIKGIGEKYAQKIVSRFGLDTLRILDEEPERLAEVEGLGKKRVRSIIDGWAEQRAVRDVMVFLQAHGASPALAMRIHKRYGPAAIQVVSEDPYRLAIEVWGVGFKTADRLAAELGIARDSPQRMQAGVLQTVHDASEAGHAYIVEAELVERAAAMLEIDLAASRQQLVRAIDALAAGRHVVVEQAFGARIVFAADIFAAEQRAARRLAEIAARPPKPLRDTIETAISAFEESAGVVLAPEQRQAVERLGQASVLVVTGGPGVGKTTIVRAMISALAQAGHVVRLAAPTGRAAKRMSEATGREASTLHRLLDFDPKRGVFKRDAKTPLEADAIIVDETSMVDIHMADALLQATEPGTRLVLVGDVDQLPSVGPGAFLRDVLASNKVPSVRLTQIFRQARESLIVVNAHRIHAGEMPELGEPGDTKSDFYMVERREPEAARDTVLELVARRIPRRFGLDPVRDVQVLTPMHRGPAGSQALNEALQAELNPSGKSLTRGGRAFRVGDKVMQLRNDYDKNVFNGDVGIVQALEEEEGTLLVRYDDGREATYEGAELDELTLAYACSVHKSQGSEYPAVVLVLLTSHFVMLSRNLLYTAVTRGRRLVVLVADPRAVSLALRSDTRERGEERRTRLAERLRSIQGLGALAKTPGL